MCSAVDSLGLFDDSVLGLPVHAPSVTPQNACTRQGGRVGALVGSVGGLVTLRGVGGQRIGNVRSATVDSLDEPTFTQNLCSPPDGEVSNAILLCQVALCGQSRPGLKFSSPNPRLDVVGDGGIDELGSLWVEVGHLSAVTHISNVSQY